jgi:transcriptional regulator with XRE-family HTH domain
MADTISNIDKQISNLGKRLKTLRKAAGYSSAEKLAYAKEINRAQYSKYEAGADIRFSSLVKVLEALGVSLEEFFREGFELMDE